MCHPSHPAPLNRNKRAAKVLHKLLWACDGVNNNNADEKGCARVGCDGGKYSDKGVSTENRNTFFFH